MRNEIALPYPAAIEAIDELEQQGVLLVGWEALGAYEDGSLGHYPAPEIGGLCRGAAPRPGESWSAAVRESAIEHRLTIEDEWRTRTSTPPRAGVELLFCFSVRRESDA